MINCSGVGFYADDILPLKLKDSVNHLFPKRCRGFTDGAWVCTTAVMVLTDSPQFLNAQGVVQPSPEGYQPRRNDP